jgi:hypothetical protein
MSLSHPTLAEEAVDHLWEFVKRRHPQAGRHSICPNASIRLTVAAENAIEEWIRGNVPPSAHEIIARSAEFHALEAHLAQICLPLPEFGCFVAVSKDKTAVFECPMRPDGTPEMDGRFMNWGEVTAPEPAFVEAVNSVFGTSFRSEAFAGR